MNFKKAASAALAAALTMSISTPTAFAIAAQEPGQLDTYRCALCGMSTTLYDVASDQLIKYEDYYHVGTIPGIINETGSGGISMGEGKYLAMPYKNGSPMCTDCLETEIAAANPGDGADDSLGDQSAAEEPVAQGSSTVQKDHQSVKVYASANGSYVLRVPESINLHNTDKSDLGSGIYKNDTDCQITLRGDVRQDQKITVTVTNPTMQSEGCEDKPANVDVSSKTVWNRDDLFAGAAQDDGSYSEPTGTSTVYPVSAELTPGDWVGTATFNCTLSTDASEGGGSGSTGGSTEDPAKKNLIPAGAKYTVAATGETLTGDGATVEFPEVASRGDTYVDEDYTYECRFDGHSYSWDSVDVNDKTKTAYGPIRSYICDKNVTSLSWTFINCANMIESPAVPDSVTDMDSTFYGCHSLVTAPVIPNGVTDMESTFSFCKSLKTYVGSTDPDGDFSKFKIPDGVTNMNSAFSACASLVTAPVIPNGVTNMDSAFSGWTHLVNAPAIPDGVTSMQRTFEGCKSLVAAPAIPDSVTNVAYTFSGCANITEAPAIPNRVTNMHSTFQNCTSLANAPVIPNSITDMGYTFYNCTNLTGTLICHANPTEYNRALYNTKITAIEGSCSEETKTALLATK